MPYKVLRTEGNASAEIEFGADRQQVNLQLLPDVKPGDWILVNVGYAIAKIDEEEAQEIRGLYREMAEADVTSRTLSATRRRKRE
jgi:hydrogenase expression/formation protein HypC